MSELPKMTVEELLGRYADGEREFRRLDLSGADLSNRNLDGIVLIGSNLAGSKLDNSSFQRASLQAVDFQQASMCHANFSPSAMIRADLFQAKLSEANLAGAILDESCMVHADLSRASLFGTSLDETLVGNTQFNGMTLAFTDLTKLSYGKADDGTLLLNTVDPLTLRMTARSFWKKVAEKVPPSVTRATRDDLIMFFYKCGWHQNLIQLFFTDEIAKESEVEREKFAYDVFISFKNLDDAGRPTRDSEIAQQAYDYLTSRGLRVFFSKVTLEKQGISAYKKAIDDVLDQSAALLSVGTTAAHLEATWVRYEWDSFFNDILSGTKPKGRVFALIEGMGLRDLPRPLRQVQVFQMNDDGLMSLFNFLSGKADNTK